MGKMVTIPEADYRRLLEESSELLELRAYDRAKADLAAGEDELIPAEFVDRLLAGENPVRVFRAFRGLTQVALSDASGVNRVQIADIEAGRSKGSIETMRKLAGVLSVTIDDIV